VEVLFVLAKGLGKVVVQAPC
jgi:hypothetical protein